MTSVNRNVLNSIGIAIFTCTTMISSCGAPPLKPPKLKVLEGARTTVDGKLYTDYGLTARRYQYYVHRPYRDSRQIMLTDPLLTRFHLLHDFEGHMAFSTAYTTTEAFRRGVIDVDLDQGKVDNSGHVDSSTLSTWSTVDVIVNG